MSRQMPPNAGVRSSLIPLGSWAPTGRPLTINNVVQAGLGASGGRARMHAQQRAHMAPNRQVWGDMGCTGQQQRKSVAGRHLSCLLHRLQAAAGSPRIVGKHVCMLVQTSLYDHSLASRYVHQITVLWRKQVAEDGIRACAIAACHHRHVSFCPILSSMQDVASSLNICMSWHA